jgi:ABC-type branched-subunit amino acid transport system ATPase component
VLLVEQRAREALTISNYAYVMASGAIQIAARAEAILDRPDLSDVFLGQAVQ